MFKRADKSEMTSLHIMNEDNDQGRQFERQGQHTMKDESQKKKKVQQQLKLFTNVYHAKILWNVVW